MKTKFEPSDFSTEMWTESISDDIAERANAKLERLFADAVHVWGYKFGECPDLDWRIHNYSGGLNVAGEPSHTALLVGIEEIKPKECEHKATNLIPPYSAENNAGPGEWMGICKHCGAKLKAKWSVVDE